MNKDTLNLINKIKYNHKQKKLWKIFVGVLSCITIFITFFLLANSAKTESSNKTYTFHLIDNLLNENYVWKTINEGEYTTSYDLNLYFVDTNGNYIEGKDLTLSINQIEEDTPYGLGYTPLASSASTETRGQDLIEAYGLTEYVLPTGEKYIFDHAEVSLDGATWHSFNKNDNVSSIYWNIWCQSSSSSTKPTSYGWRGNYETETGQIRYDITENTEYKLVFKKVRQGVENSVLSLGADSGIAFNIYNYSGDNTETGVNANGLYDYFTFRDSTLTDAPYINSTTDADGFTSQRAKVESKLDSNGYPVFDCQGYCASTNIINTSLGYLFGSSTNALGQKTVGVSSYISTNTPLQKETINNVLYYYYDSNRNAIDYDVENNRFMVRNYLERGYIISTYEKESKRYEFLPFNYLVEKDNTKTYDYESADDKTEIDHWYGMTMEFEFYMPKNGKINDQDMIFEFSGDDDVWVFIDNVLVLDLGGTHGAVDGKINFATGEVVSYLNWNGVVGTKENETRNETNIYKMFENASSTSSIKWNDTKTTFENYTKHTLKFFYLERGAAVANCKIKFNIPVLPSGSLSVLKEYDGTDNYNENHEFTLYDITTGSSVPVQNAAYTKGNKTYYTDSFGKFILKTNEEAIFKLTNEHTYYVEETKPGNHSASYKCNFDGKSCPSKSKTSSFTINPESSYQAVFTNKIKTYDLSVTKEVYGTTNETFDFEVNLSKDGKVVDVPDNSESKYEVNHDKGIITFSLKNKESITIKDIPVDTSVTLKEIKHDGYNVVIKNKEETLTSGDTYTFILTKDKDITVHNIPGVYLPETGGKGILSYLLIGISLILVSIKFRYKLEVNKK